MTLRAARLTTHCVLPRGQEQAAPLIEETARRILPRTLAARLGPSLDRESEVLRLKMLNVMLRIDLDTLQRGVFADRWADVLARSLHEALARPAGDGFFLYRYERREDYLAAMIAAVLAGQSAADWRFPELPATPGRPRAILLLDIFLGAGRHLPGLLETLLHTRQLNTALGLLDEVGLDRLLRAVTEVEESPAPMSIVMFTEIAVLLSALGVPPQTEPAASRRQAISIWLAIHRRPSPRAVWHSLQMLRRVLREPAFLDPQQSETPLAGMPDWCSDLRHQLARERSAALAVALEQLRAVTPGAVPPGARETWIASDAAGLMLLCAPIRRLRWPQRLRDHGHAPRVLQALLAGAAMRLVRQAWMPGDPLDPAAALLAGIMGESDPHGLAVSMQGAPPDGLELTASNWNAFLDLAAEALARSLAHSIRGFQTATRDSIARHFLRRRGRILLGDKALRVDLEPNPWWVAVHVSGADDALPPLGWLSDRSVAFVLEGL
jgi:hypothetical protein